MASSEQARSPKRRPLAHQPETPDGAPTVGDDDRHDDLAALQRSVGNRAVAALVQAKLRVGAVDDPLEHEADRVASKVVAAIEHHDVGETSPGDGPAADDDVLAASAASGTPTVRRRATPDGSTAAGGELDTGTDTSIRQASGGGQALDPGIRHSMEAGFGGDFSAVRVHLDAGADALNRQLDARAFTAGSDIFFRKGEYDPATTGGKELIAHELTHVVQQGSATSAGATVARKPQPQTVQRKAYPIGSTGEKLEVGIFTSKKEREALLAEAAQIMSDLQATYGVAVSSSTTVQGIRDQYTDVSDRVRDSLRTQAWRIKELRALSRALAYYSAILGANRENSTRKDADQEVTSVGKVKQAINEDTPAGKLDTTTLGEYFASKKNMGLFRASEKYKADFKSLEDQLTGTFVHEIAHGLLAYAIPDYIAATGYWRDRYKELPKGKRVESPVTDYGETSADEDICESAMMYFIAPQRLKSSCPLRYAFMKKIGTDWVPAPSEAPQVQPDAVGVVPEVSGSGSPTIPPELEQAQEAIEKILQKVDSPAPEDVGDQSTSATPAPSETSSPDTSGGELVMGGHRARKGT